MLSMLRCSYPGVETTRCEMTALAPASSANEMSQVQYGEYRDGWPSRPRVTKQTRGRHPTNRMRNMTTRFVKPKRSRLLARSAHWPAWTRRGAMIHSIGMGGRITVPLSVILYGPVLTPWYHRNAGSELTSPAGALGVERNSSAGDAPEGRNPEGRNPEGRDPGTQIVQRGSISIASYHRHWRWGRVTDREDFSEAAWGRQIYTAHLSPRTLSLLHSSGADGCGRRGPGMAMIGGLVKQVGPRRKLCSVAAAEQQH